MAEGAAPFASLEGKLALVTGASKGIGRAIAQELARGGAEGGADDGKRLGEEAGDVDVLVNNAGLTRDGLLARMSDDDWRTVIETNPLSVFYTCRAVDSAMMEKGG